VIILSITYLLLLVSLLHGFLFFYNRYLLCLPDGPWKKPIHHAWFVVSFVLPALVSLLLLSWAPFRRALMWQPDTLLARVFFLGLMALIAFTGTRFLIWLQRRTMPDKPEGLIEEMESRPVMPIVRSRLPQGLRRLETTGDLLVTEREIAVAGLAPAFDGLTVVQVSDVHFGQRLEMEAYLQGVQELVAQLDPDIVLLTGDFTDHRRDIVKAVEYHAGFRGRIATFAVMGNHDYWTNPDRALAALGKTHIIWLGGGERRILKRNGRRLIFTGTDYPWSGERPDWRRIVRRETGDAVVLLSHTPDNAPAAARHGASVIFSGHNHGGQICLPLLGPVVVPSRYGLKYAGGCYRVGVDSVLNVSRGVGVSQGGIRVLCPPEICLLRLRAPVVEVMAGRVIPARSLLRPAQTGEAAGGFLANRSGRVTFPARD
jgi:predicted MPP superfamily phosphohydrolase